MDARRDTMDKKHIGFGIIVVVVLLFAFNLFQKPSYDQFAQCLTEKGVKFYGAYWCPHCNDQKDMFGSSIKYVPYVECALPDTNSQTKVCQDAKIESYPTWIFPGGVRKTGTLPLTDISKFSGCPLK